MIHVHLPRDLAKHYRTEAKRAANLNVRWAELYVRFVALVVIPAFAAFMGWQLLIR